MLLRIGHAALREDDHVHPIDDLCGGVRQPLFELLLIEAESPVHQAVHQLHMRAHLPGDSRNGVLRRRKRRRERCHHAHALSEPHRLAAHLLVHPNDGNAEIPCRVLRAVRHLAHGGAEIQHRVNALFHGLHIHADQPGCRRGRHIPCRTHIRQNARILQGEQRNILPQLLFHFTLHIRDKFRCGAGINQTDLHFSPPVSALSFPPARLVRTGILYLFSC